VVKLVHEIKGAPKNSLILLDEPETSLHPGAQQGLIQFLLKETLEKKLHVVISTHSANIITSPPKEAIKVLHTNKVTGKTEIIEDIQPEEAFFYIGETNKNKKYLIVEDKTAKLVVDAVLKDMGEGIDSLITVKYYPGGAATINQKLIPVYSQEWKESNSFVLFDGDQQRCDSYDPSSILERDQTKEKLKGIIFKQVGSNIKFSPDNDRDDQEICQMLDYLNYYYNKVFYLPLDTPEDIIWNDDVLNKAAILDIEKKSILSEPSVKERYVLFSQAMFGESNKDSIYMSHKYFMIRWLEHKNDNKSYNSIKKVFDSIRDDK